MSVHFVRYRSIRPRRLGSEQYSAEPQPLTVACDSNWLTFERSTRCDVSSNTSTSTPPSDVQGRVTIVTQLSRNRLSSLLSLAGRWPHAIVAALASEPDADALYLPPHLALRVRLVMHPVADKSSISGNRFPINTLRNLAIANVRTSHFLVLDVDLWPSNTLAAELMALDRAFWTTPGIALLVPAFQLVDGTRRAAQAEEEASWEQADSAAVASGRGNAAFGLGVADDPTHGRGSERSGVPSDAADLRRCVRERQCVAFKGQPIITREPPSEEGSSVMQAVPGQQLSTDYALDALRGRQLPYRIRALIRSPSSLTSSCRFPISTATTTSAPNRLAAGIVAYQASRRLCLMSGMWAMARTRSNGCRISVHEATHFGSCLARLSLTCLTTTKAGKLWAHNARGHKERMDALFEEQLKHDAESESHRLRLMQSSDEQALHDDFSSICSRTLPVCKTPLVQVIDPLDPSFAGRRASVDRIMG